MVEDDSCEGCQQAHDCQKVYRQLGKTEGPSVAAKVVVAFLLPIFVFAAGLGVFGRLLGGVLAPRYQTPLAFALALSVTVGVVLIASLIVRRLHRNT